MKYNQAFSRVLCEAMALMENYGWLLFLGLFIAGAGCAEGVSHYRELIINDLNRQLPQGIGIKYPHLSWNMSKLVESHREYFPESNIPKRIRLLTFISVGIMSVLGLTCLIIVLIRPLIH